MNISFKLNYSVSYFLSGFIFLISCLGLYENWNIDQIVNSLMKVKDIFVIVGFTTIVVSFFIGIVFDAIRNSIIDKIFDKFRQQRLNIHSFVEADEKMIREITDDYYTFYVLNLDVAIGLFILILINIKYLFTSSPSKLLVLSLILYIFITFFLLLDSYFIRKSMDELIKKHSKSKKHSRKD